MSPHTARVVVLALISSGCAAGPASPPANRRELATARPAATAEPVTVEAPPPRDGTQANEATVDLLADPEPVTRVQTDAESSSLAPIGLEFYGSRAAMREPTRFVFRWPIGSVNISSPFGVRRNPFRKRARGGGHGWHAGLDLSADSGEQILAAGPGRVLRSGWFYGFGKHVSIEHEGGFVTHYGHMSEILVFAGQRVRRGAPIGLVGSTGRSTGPHLHFTLQHRGKSIDPLAYIGRPNDE